MFSKEYVDEQEDRLQKCQDELSLIAENERIVELQLKISDLLLKNRTMNEEVSTLKQKSNFEGLFAMYERDAQISETKMTWLMNQNRKLNRQNVRLQRELQFLRERILKGPDVAEQKNFHSLQNAIKYGFRNLDDANSRNKELASNLRRQKLRNKFLEDDHITNKEICMELKHAKKALAQADFKIAELKGTINMIKQTEANQERIEQMKANETVELKEELDRLHDILRNVQKREKLRNSAGRLRWDQNLRLKQLAEKLRSFES